MSVKAWAAAIAAAAVTLGLTGSGAPNSMTDPPAPGADASSTSQPAIRLVQYGATCDSPPPLDSAKGMRLAVQDPDWQQIYSVCVVPYPGARSSTTYIVNETEDLVLSIKPTSASLLQTAEIGGPFNTRIVPGTSKIVTDLVRDKASRPIGDREVLVPPGWFATTTGSVEVSRHYSASFGIILGQAIAKYAQSKTVALEEYVKERISPLKTCLEGSMTEVEGNRKASASTAPTTFIPDSGNLPHCNELIGSIDTPPHPKKPPRIQDPHNGNSSSFRAFLAKNPLQWDTPLALLNRFLKVAKVP
ncbi:hypothetical protein [Nocardia salmonicida]|uniref:hypothetical protein n=1 Tax=Nocardia salmonicida TaxID=53431 RepID=UPI002E29B4C5|nr:hypothetical protein [Nocardia salmonicida]